MYLVCASKLVVIRANSTVHGYQHCLDRRAMAGQLQTFGTLENASAKLVYPSTLTYKERASLAKSDAVEYCRWEDLSGLVCVAAHPSPRNITQYHASGVLLLPEWRLVGPIGVRSFIICLEGCARQQSLMHQHPLCEL